MIEIIVGGLSVLIGTVFSIRAWWRIRKEKQAAIVLGLRGDTPEWTIIMGKWTTVLLVALGQLIMGTAVVLVIVFEPPRPSPVREFVTWAVVAMPAILGALSVHAEVAYQTEMRVLMKTRDQERE